MTEANDYCDPDPLCRSCGGNGAVDSGGQTPWGEWIEVPCFCTRNTLEQWKMRCEGLEGELNRLREGIRFWSYCTSQGMLSVCPEKVEELGDFLINCGIAPYYTKKQAETVKQ